MNNRLDQNQQEKVSRKYHEHPLLCACQLAFRNYQARMRYLMFSPVEVFVEAIKVIDDILEDGTDRMDFISNLWENLTIRYKLWCTGVPDDNEFQIAVSSVFYAVSITMSIHSHPYFKDTIKDALLKEIDSHTSVVKQEEDKVIVALSQYADELRNWLDSYVVNDTYLSDDIDDVANDRKPRSLKVVHPKNKSNRTIKQERPKADYSKFSFELKPKGRFKAKKDKALEFLHGELTAKKFIMDVKDLTINEDISQFLNVEEKNKLVFNTVFSGVDTDYHIVWIGTAKELGYFINQLEERGAISWKDGPRKWQVTRNRIWQGKKEYTINEATGKKQYTYIIEPFKENAFDKNLIPADTSKLDAILNLIAPVEKVNNTKIGMEIEAEFRYYSNFEEDNENDRGEKLSQGFRDRSHKGKE